MPENMPQPDDRTVFVKTVRSNGHSVYARGYLCQTYEIGKRYQFHPKLPAHVGMSLYSYCNLRDAYEGRPEHSGGSRLLLCIGTMSKELVPVFDITLPTWKPGLCNYEYIRTSTDFEVIGEVFVPKEMVRRENDLEGKEEDTHYLDPALL